MKLETTFDLQNGHITDAVYQQCLLRGAFHEVTSSWYTAREALPEDFSGYTTCASREVAASKTYVLAKGSSVVRLIVEGETIRVSVADRNREQVFTILQELWARYPERVVQEDRIAMRFWYATSQGPTSNTRLLEAPQFEDIRGNYPLEVAAGVDPLLDAEWRPGAGGQLLLWHGPPGCGKTYAIRALVRKWAPWCQASYVVDPDAFFGNAA